MLNFFKKKKTKHTSEFSRFFHEASSDLFYIKLLIFKNVNSELMCEPL